MGVVLKPKQIKTKTNQTKAGNVCPILRADTKVNSQIVGERIFQSYRTRLTPGKFESHKQECGQGF